MWCCKSGSPEHRVKKKAYKSSINYICCGGLAYNSRYPSQKVSLLSGVAYPI